MATYGMNKMGVNLNVPLSSALFTVDSRDGIRTDPVTGFVVDAQNPYDIQIYKNQQLFSGAVQRIALTEINMPFNVPNVNPYNNVLYLESSTGEVVAVGDVKYTDELGAEQTNEIPLGFYTPQELAIVLKENLNFDGGVFGVTGWNVTYSVNNFPPPAGGVFGNIINFPVFSIQNSGVSFRVKPMFGLDKGTYSNINTNPVTRVKRSSTLAEMMGYSNASQSFSNTQYGNYASMLYTNYVDIVSPFLSKHMEVRDTSSSYFNGYDIVARVYLSREGYDRTQTIDTSTTEPTVVTDILGTRPFHLHYNFPFPKQIRWSPTEFLPSCNLRMQDQYGNVLYGVPSVINTTSGVGIAGNSNWVEMSFLISEIN